MRAVWHIAVKDLRVLLRDPAALTFALGFPVVLGIFLATVLGGAFEGKTVSVPIVVSTDVELMKVVAMRLTMVPGVSVEALPGAEAERRVRTGRAAAVLRVGTDGHLELGVDPTRATETQEVRAALTNALTSAPPPFRVVEITDRDRVRKGTELAFPASLLWGLIGCAAAFSVSLVSERARGTLDRLRCAPISNVSIVLGKFTACFLACLGTASILILLGHFVGVQTEGRELEVALAVVAASAAFSGLTMALGSMGRSEQGAAGAGWAVLVVLAMLGGGMVPLSLMPEWLRSVGAVSPVRWGIEALEGALFRELTMQEILFPVGMLLTFSVLSLSVGAAALSFSQRRSS